MNNEFPRSGKFPQSEVHQPGICNALGVLPSKSLNTQGGILPKNIVDPFQ